MSDHPPAPSPQAQERGLQVLAALRMVLIEQMGIRGNTRTYYDERNSFLNEGARDRPR